MALVHRVSQPSASPICEFHNSNLLKNKFISALVPIISNKSHSEAELQTMFCSNKQNTLIIQRDAGSKSTKLNNKADFLYLSHCVCALSLHLCLWFSRLQPQCLGCDWFKYHPISLTCTDRAARANYIHLVMWLGFQVVNILWQHAPPAAAATHQCAYIIPQLRTRDQKHPPEYTLSSRSWQYKHEKWMEGETGGDPHTDMPLLW